MEKIMYGGAFGIGYGIPHIHEYTVVKETDAKAWIKDDLFTDGRTVAVTKKNRLFNSREEAIDFVIARAQQKIDEARKDLEDAEEEMKYIKSHFSR